MQDLAGLGFARPVFPIRLGGGEEGKHAPREAGPDPQRLQGSDQTVAAEWSGKPEHPSIRIGTVAGFRDQRLQIGDGAIQPIVELLIVGDDLGTPCHSFDRRPIEFPQRGGVSTVTEIGFAAGTGDPRLDLHRRPG